MSSFLDAVLQAVADFFGIRRDSPPRLGHLGVYEYRVDGQAGGRVTLVPAKTKLLGALPNVYQWAAPGTEATWAAGASVAVAFLDSDPSRPIILGALPSRLTGGIPTALTIDTTGAMALGPTATSVAVGNTFTPGAAPAAVGHLARFGDTVQIGSGTPGILTWVSGPVSTGKS